MAHPNLWGTTDTRNGLPTTTRESPDFSHGECQQFKLVLCVKTHSEHSIKTPQVEITAKSNMEGLKQ